MATKYLKLSIQINATDNNVHPCSLIWYRLVDAHHIPLTSGWEFTTNNFNSQNTLNIELFYDKNTLHSCAGDMVELYIIPCCSLTDIITGIDCDNCGNISTQELPSILPSTTYHNYIPIDYTQVNTTITTQVGFYLYAIPNAKQYTTINVSGNSGCILGPDTLCSEVSINASIPVQNNSSGNTLYIWGRGLTFSDSAFNTINPTLLQPLDANQCLFTPHNYLLINNREVVFEYYYQDITYQAVVSTLSNGQIIIIQALPNTVFVNADSGVYTLIDMGIIVS